MHIAILFLTDLCHLHCQSSGGRHRCRARAAGGRRLCLLDGAAGRAAVGRQDGDHGVPRAQDLHPVEDVLQGLQGDDVIIVDI